MRILFSKNYLSVLLTGLIFFLSVTSNVSGNISVDEIDLNPTGQALEINMDTLGLLWVTDYSAREIWSFDPEAGTYQIFPVGGNPSDARRMGTDLWWVDGAIPLIGRVSTLTGDYTLYTVPNPSNRLFSTTFDAGGNFWASDYDLPRVYKVSPAGSSICTFALPDSAEVGYMTADGSASVWLGDMNNSRIIQLNINSGAINWWPLPTGASPYSLAIDNEEHIWYSDMALGELAELNPLTSILHRYGIPNGSVPMMISLDGDRVWYTSQIVQSIGFTNQTSASFIEFISSKNAVPPPLTLDCKSTQISSSGKYPWPLATHTFSAISTQYALLTDQPEWKIIQVPLTAGLWGITIREGDGWVVDYARKKLVKIIPPPETATLAACKLADADGSLITTGDQTTVADWGMTLYKDNVSQGQQVTGSDGCTTWTDLPLGAAYKVVEEARSGWSALTSVECDKGVISDSGSYSCEFINWQPPEYQIYLPLILR